MGTMGLASVYRFWDIFLSAVNLIPELKLVFPQNDVDVRQANKAFHVQSKSGIMAGCIGCIDGYLATIT
jgi:hypothetical protein